MKKNNNINYVVKQNNYVGLLFFALVLASILYIAKHEEITLNPKKNDTYHEIESIPGIFEENDPLIIELRKYLNPGNRNTYFTYQSSYVTTGVNVTEISNESLLYMAYQYLMQQDEYNKKRDITEEEMNILKLNNTNKVSSLINKQLLKNTINNIYNINNIEFVDFYTNYNDKCYLINNEYICIDNEQIQTNKIGKTEFVSAYENDNTIEIIEKYQYLEDEEIYKDFNKIEVGEQEYISTFKKINDKYIYISTKRNQ